MSRVFRGVQPDRLDKVFAASVQRRVADGQPRQKFAALKLTAEETNFPRPPLKTPLEKVEHKGTDALGIIHRLTHVKAKPVILRFSYTKA
jgi:hypothetical protein